MLRRDRQSVIAQPLAEGKWQVVAGDWDRPRGERVIGFILELGGTYEVDVVGQPSLRQFFNTFKDAMEYIHMLEGGSGERGAMAAGAAW